MKRLLPLLFALFTTASYAQVGELRDNLALGFGGGYNLSSVDFSPLRSEATGDFPLKWLSNHSFTGSLLCVCLELSDSLRPFGLLPQAPLSMGFFQARILEWVAISSSRGSFSPRD